VAHEGVADALDRVEGLDRRHHRVVREDGNHARRRYPPPISRNGRNSPPRPRLEIAQAGASSEEAAAIAAAIEQFIRDTAPAAVPPRPIEGWRRAGLFEGVGLGADSPSPWLEPWGDPEPWGSAARG
jgi:hypothetical protein